jgi:hypothetical protein
MGRWIIILKWDSLLDPTNLMIIIIIIIIIIIVINKF